MPKFRVSDRGAIFTRYYTLIEDYCAEAHPLISPTPEVNGYIGYELENNTIYQYNRRAVLFADFDLIFNIVISRELSPISSLDFGVKNSDNFFSVILVQSPTSKHIYGLRIGYIPSGEQPIILVMKDNIDLTEFGKGNELQIFSNIAVIYDKDTGKRIFNHNTYIVTKDTSYKFSGSKEIDFRPNMVDAIPYFRVSYSSPSIYLRKFELYKNPFVDDTVR